VLLKRGRERGWVTYEELNEALPPDRVTAEDIEEGMSRLAELGIDVVESDPKTASV